MTEIDWLAADLHRLGDKPITALLGTLILSFAHKKNSTSLETFQLERVVDTQYSRLLRPQQDSNALSTSKGISKVDAERTGHPTTDSRVTALTVEGRATALRITGA